MSAEIWIAFIEVADPAGKLLKGAPGAFVNVLAFATDEADYERQVRRMMKEAGFAVVSRKLTEPFRQRRARGEVEEALTRAAAALQPGEVRYGTFHAFAEGGS